MIFGSHSYVFTDRWSDDSLSFLDQARALGLDCFEIGVGDDVIFDRTATRRHAEALGLELAISPGGAWPLTSDMSSEDPTERAEGLAWQKKQVNTAHDLGALAYCGCAYGHTGVIKRRRPPPDEYARIAEGLHALAVYGEEKGVTIVLEPMSHFRTHLVNTPRQVMQLVDMSDHSNLKVLLDTYHLVTEITDYAEGIHDVSDRLWGIHACENNRGRPGTGILPWNSIFGAMKEIAFDGHVIMETYNSSLGDFAYERAMFHNVCPDAHDFIQKGLAFLKDGLA
jgi:D-psicose/D-tagatose/L-ribulose 3-epimerase